MDILAETQLKVKQTAKRLITRGDFGLSKPLKKLVLEMSFGIMLTGSCTLNEIARRQGEEIKLKHTLKRFYNMLRHGEKVLNYCNRVCLEEMKPFLNDQTVLALDGGDIVHVYGSKFENMTTVRDGSKKEFRSGYWLNQVSGYDPVSKESFPLLFDIYSTLEEGFKSANDESIAMIKRVREVSLAKVLWVLDRGYDGEPVLKYLLAAKETFMLRMTGKRNLLYKGKSVNIEALAKSINRRNKYGNHARYGSMKVQIKMGYWEYEVTLVVLKNEYNQEPIIFMTNGWIKSSKELKRRIRGYFYRWGVEESYRFEKQSFGIEKTTVRNYDRIKSLIGLSLFAWLLLVKSKQDEKVNQVLLKQAKPEKTQKNKQPKFIYYRLVKGMQNLFSTASRLFIFREKSKKKTTRSKVDCFTPKRLFPTKICHELFSLEMVG